MFIKSFRTYAMIIPLLLFVHRASAAENIFDNTKECKSDVIEKIKSIQPGNKQQEINELIQKYFNWAVVYSTYTDFPKDSKITFHKDKIEEIEPSGKKMTTKDAAVTWDSLISGENPYNLKIFLWEFEQHSLVLAYYLCKTKGGNKNGQSHFGIAFSLDRNGGIPAEAHDAADIMKGTAEKHFGVKEDQFKLYKIKST